MKLLPASNSNKGFTLLELLVVIGILGILAAGLLATIDPLEQFRKGQDSNKQQAAVEYMNALTRYYATHEVMPWVAPAGGAAACAGPGAVGTAAKLSAVAVNACTTVLKNEGELKSTFQDAASVLDALYLTDKTTGTDTNVAVCFLPQSKSQQARPDTKYVQNGDNSTTACGAGTDCYWCAR